MGFAVICSGQGDQAPDLFARFPFTEKGLAVRARVVAAGCLAPDVAARLEHPERSPADIFLNRFSQPLICLYQAMVWAELSLPTPDFFAGYSLGELSAYGCAGALRPEDVVRLAGGRARAMDAAGAGELVAVVGLDVEKVEAAIGGQGGHLAIVLGATHCVVGCPPHLADALRGALVAAGASETVLLPVSVPSHTPILDDAVAPFREVLAGVPWAPPAAPILAGVSGEKVFTRPQMLELLPEQIHRTVRWDFVSQRLVESGCRVVLELGPGCQLAHAFLSVAHGAEARSCDEFRSADGISEWVRRSLDRMG